MSMLYVNRQDESNEQEVLTAVSSVFPDFSGIQFLHQYGISPFDFQGFINGRLEVACDVKVRDIHHNLYRDYFVSEDKVGWMESHGIPCYVVYSFLPTRRIRVFMLNGLDMDRRVIRFHHKRADRDMERSVYCVPSSRFVAEYVV